MDMTSSAFATSMPTNTEAAGGIVEPPRCGRSTEARPCRIRADARATVRALTVEWATPTLTLGLGDRRHIELSPVVVASWLTLSTAVRTEDTRRHRTNGWATKA